MQTLANPDLPLCTVGFHLSDFMWAVGCVMSRQNKLPCQGSPEKTTMALIPLWDMANHENGRVGVRVHYYLAVLASLLMECSHVVRF